MNGVAGMIAAYVAGSIPAGYILVRLVKGVDVRSRGSGNLGATNVIRVAGPALGLISGGCDVAKGFAAVSIMGLVHPQGCGWWEVGAALAAIAGHNWPVWLKFRGGRGVLTSTGAFLNLAWAPVVLACAIFILVFAATRYVSVGSMVAAAALLPLLTAIPGPWQTPPVMTLAALAAILIILRHVPNLRRLIAGEELAFGSKVTRKGGRKKR